MDERRCYGFSELFSAARALGVLQNYDPSVSQCGANHPADASGMHPRVKGGRERCAEETVAKLHSRQRLDRHPHPSRPQFLLGARLRFVSMDEAAFREFEACCNLLYGDSSPANKQQAEEKLVQMTSTPSFVTGVE